MRRYLLPILIIAIIMSFLVVFASAVEGDPLAGGSPEPTDPSVSQDIDAVNPDPVDNPYFHGTLKTSAACIEMLKSMEGYIKKPAGDYQQTSIGYGCNVKYLRTYHKELDISAEDLELVLDTSVPNYILKEEKAEALMMYVLVEIEEDLDKFLDKYGIQVNQYQYDSLISFTYNLGTAWMSADSRLGEVLVSGDYTINEFASAMGVYCHVTVGNEAKVLDLLVSRRIREIKLFLFGAYNLSDTNAKFCKLVYDAGDGEAETDIGFYQVGEPYQLLFDAEPTEDTDSYFIGWYTDDGVKITADTIAQASETVYARWSNAWEDPELYQDGSKYDSEGGPSVGETDYGETDWSQVDITDAFSDMHTSDWHYPYISELYTKGVINGFPDNTFRPNDTVTTGQALKMIMLAAGYTEPDPVASHWARNFLNLALEQGIIERGEITDLDVPITRGLMAKVVANSMGLVRINGLQYFPDTDDDYVQMLFEYGLSEGYTDGTFQPGNSLTRAELSAIVCRMYDCN